MSNYTKTTSSNKQIKCLHRCRNPAFCHVINWNYLSNFHLINWPSQSKIYGSTIDQYKNLTMRQSHIPQYTVQNRDVLISVLKGSNWLGQVMAWCQTATHYRNQCWPTSMSLYGITWPTHCVFFIIIKCCTLLVQTPTLSPRKHFHEFCIGNSL